MSLLRDRRRKFFDMGLVRMTNSREGGLAKVVRRRLEVLHLSGDGATALLGVDVKPEDTRVLEIGDEGKTYLQRDVQVFKLQMKHGSSSVNFTDSTNFSGLPFTNFENIAKAMARYAPSIFMVLGPDRDGILRHMGLSRIFSETATDCMEPMMDTSAIHVPLYNIRVGDLHIKAQAATSENRALMTRTDIAWMGWLLPGDDRNSHEFPWQFKESAGQAGPGMARAATNGCSFLVSFFTNRLVGLLCLILAGIQVWPRHIIQFFQVHGWKKAC